LFLIIRKHGTSAGTNPEAGLPKQKLNFKVMKTYNILKKYILILVLGLVTVVPAVAQTAKPAEQRAKETTDLMKCELNLLDRQVADVMKVNLQAAKEMDDISAKYRMNVEELYKQAKEVDRKRDIALQDVLKPSQWSQYEKIRTDRNVERQQKREEICRKQ
jgi:hypothetical protein